MKEYLTKTQNQAYTINGALAYRSTLSHVVDLFTLGGSYRDASRTVMIEKLIVNALLEDTVSALKVIFYLSDIRQGQGNRDLFRNAFRVLLIRDIELTKKLLPYVAEFGRWDYLYWFMHTPLHKDALELFKHEIDCALKTGKPNLVFKWLASEVATSKITRQNARYTREYLGLSPRNYRKLLSEGRKNLGSALVERKMSSRDWGTIQYKQVASIAMTRYTHAFTKHSPDLYASYLEEVTAGYRKINANVLYPYNILHQYVLGHNNALEVKSLLAQWNALPNYVSEDVRTIAVVDNSGSMFGTPIEVALSLGIYLSERLSGPFKDSVISFSSIASFFDLSKFDTVFKKYEYIKNNSIVESTNLFSVFELILNTALKYHVPADQLPNRIVIVSDMQFDSGVDDSGVLNHHLTTIKTKYADAGYDLPQVIYWNVSVYANNVPATINDKGIILISGYSPVILKNILSSVINITPYQLMMKVINSPRYNFIEKL